MDHLRFTPNYVHTMVSQFNLISHYFLSKHTNITGCLANMHGSTLCFSNKYKRFVLWAFVTVKLRVSSWLENGTMDQNTRKNTILPFSSAILLVVFCHSETLPYHEILGHLLNSWILRPTAGAEVHSTTSYNCNSSKNFSWNQCVITALFAYHRIGM